MKQYNKLWVALSGVFAVLGTVLADGHVTTTEALGIFSALVTAFGVYRVPNRPKDEV